MLLWMIMNAAGGSDVKLAYRASNNLLILSTADDLGTEIFLGGGHTLDRAPPEPGGVLRNPFLEGIGGEGGDDRAAAGKNAEQRAEYRAAHDRARRIDQVLPCGHQPGDLGFEQIARFLGQFQIADDLGEPEHPERDIGKSYAVREFGKIESHAAGTGLKVGAYHG